MHTISLDIIGPDQEAKRLYEKLGFMVIRHSSIWPLNCIFTFSFDSLYLNTKKNGTCSNRMRAHCCTTPELPIWWTDSYYAVFARSPRI